VLRAAAKLASALMLLAANLILPWTRKQNKWSRWRSSEWGKQVFGFLVVWDLLEMMLVLRLQVSYYRWKWSFFLREERILAVLWVFAVFLGAFRRFCGGFWGFLGVYRVTLMELGGVLGLFLAVLGQDFNERPPGIWCQGAAKHHCMDGPKPSKIGRPRSASKTAKTHPKSTTRPKSTKNEPKIRQKRS